MVESVWRKESELKMLREELASLDRQIKLSLKEAEKEEGQMQEQEQVGQNIPETDVCIAIPVKPTGQYMPLPHDLQQVKEVMGERLIVANTSRPQKNPING